MNGVRGVKETVKEKDEQRRKREGEGRQSEGQPF